ncbi:MAG: ABC transporter permease [Sphingomonadaceae bacterium]
MKLLLMARFTFREALHKRVVHGVGILTLGFAILYALLVWLAFREVGQAGPARMMALQLTLLGMNAVSGIAALMAVFLSVGTISSEVDAGTLHALVPKPLTRRDVLMGKWLGFAAMLTAYVIALSLMMSLTVAVFWGQWPVNFLPATMLLALESLVLLSLSILGTTFLPTVANGVVVFGLYSVAMMSGFMEQLGSMIQNEAMVNVGIGISLLVPSDTLAKLSASMLQEGYGYFERVGPFIVLSQPSGWVVVYALAYIAVLLAAAQAIFNRKDL